MKKQKHIELEDCWDCGGKGYDFSYTSSSNICKTCKETGKLPKGSWDWEKKRRAADIEITEKERDKAIDIAIKKMKIWKKKNPKPTGKVTIISE